MELKVPFLADRQLESAATELLRKYAKWKGTHASSPSPPPSPHPTSITHTSTARIRHLRPLDGSTIGSLRRKDH